MIHGQIKKEAMHEYGVELKSMDDAKNADCIIVAVAHDEFKKMPLDSIKSLFKESEDNEKVLLDVKGLYEIGELKQSGMNWWRL